MLSRGCLVAVSAASVFVLPIAGCGGGSKSSDKSSSNPPNVGAPQSFPSPNGKSIAEIRRGLGPGPVLAPAVSILEPGKNRFAFGLFDRARRQITEAPTAIYVSPVNSTQVEGPVPVQDLNLTVDKRFQSKTVFGDQNAPRSVYVTSLKFGAPGTYEILAVSRLDDRLVAANPITLPVISKARDPVPQVGEKPPRIDTPTVASVGGDVSKIDTRTPPDDMHAVNFANVLGKKPVVLAFATPLLCQSRVCGPAVDVVYQVESKYRGQAGFIHMEIYQDNNPNKGFRPQVRAFNLPTEPWIFAIDRKGTIVQRLEGAVTVPEVDAAVRAAIGR